MLKETNPYFLALTVAVTLLHSLFDLLAFKNDITFWKNATNFEGLSVRTVRLCSCDIGLRLDNPIKRHGHTEDTTQWWSTLPPHALPLSIATLLFPSFFFRPPPHSRNSEGFSPRTVFSHA